MRWAAIGCVLSCAALAAPNAPLEKAAKLFADANYGEANRALTDALKQPNNDRDTLLRILELQAIVLATLGQGDKAAVAFEQLLSLNPLYALQGNHPPRVTTAFFEARAWAEKNGALEAKQLDAVMEPGAVKSLKVELTKDPAKLVKKVRFFVGGTAAVATVTGNAATLPLKPAAPSVTWWAQLLGEKDAMLLDLGSATSTKTETAPEKPAAPAPTPPVAEAPKTDLQRPPEPSTPPVPAAEPLPPPPPMPPPMVAAVPAARPAPVGRYVAVGLLGGAAACGGVAIAFGLLANGTKAQIDTAASNGAGQVTGLTQKKAFELDAQQRQQATISNAFSIGAAALGVSGGALLVLSLTSNDSVAIVPNGLGLGIAGTLP